MISRHLFFVSRSGATLASCGVLLYLYSVWRFAVDSPFWDDYDAILVFLNILISESQSSSEVVKLFLSLHNEHRIFFPRLIAFINYFIDGEINFISLIWVGNFAWFLVIFLCWSYVKKNWHNIFRILSCFTNIYLPIAVCPDDLGYGIDPTILPAIICDA